MAILGRLNVAESGFCNHCGGPNPAGSTYCSRCGRGVTGGGGEPSARVVDSGRADGGPGARKASASTARVMLLVGVVFAAALAGALLL